MRLHTFASCLAVIAGLSFGTSAQAADHEGPHKGAVVEWGEEEYHLEVVTDAKAGTVIVYVYGNHNEFHKAKAKAIDSKSLIMTVKGAKSIAVKLTPKPVEGDAKGVASTFVGKHAVFGKEAKLKGTLSGKVGTKPYSGDFEQK